jgi:hypothetical protein
VRRVLDESAFSKSALAAFGGTARERLGQGLLIFLIGGHDGAGCSCLDAMEGEDIRISLIPECERDVRAHSSQRDALE